MLPTSSIGSLSGYGSGVMGLTGTTGNSMNDFMQGINQMTYSATHDASGQDVISWANGLLIQSQQRKQLQAQQQASLASLSGSTDSNSPNMGQLLQYMMTLLSSLGRK